MASSNNRVCSSRENSVLSGGALKLEVYFKLKPLNISAAAVGDPNDRSIRLNLSHYAVYLQISDLPVTFVDYSQS